MSSELLEKNQHQLVRVLSSLSAQDFLKLSKDLQKHRVISKQGSDILASLDHDNLDSDATVRYLLHVVGERVKVDNTLFAHFLKALTGFRNVGVVQVGESLVSEARAISQGPGEESGPVPETVFLEEDVGLLSEVLTSGSHKWEEFSVIIGIPEHIIEDCKSHRSNNLRLYKSIKEWVCGRHKNARLPTLGQLKQALSSPFVGLPDLASKIEISWKTNSDLPDSHFSDKMSESNKVLNISLEPSDTTVADGKSTLLEVQVSHSEAVSYQWMKEDKPLSDSSSFSGTHSSVLLIHKASQGVQGEYRCQVNLGSVQLSTSPVQVTVTFSPDKQRLLNFYSSLTEVPQDSWPIVGPNTFVDVALLDTMRGSKPSVVEGEVDDVLQTNLKSTVSLIEAFGQYEEGALIILEGRPGCGKTTLTCKITKDWVNGKILSDASKVFLVSLRKDYDTIELFKSFYHSKTQAYVEQLEECGGKGSCFILDGYDEFSNSQGDQSVIHQLIHKTYLPLAMVILTSRPVATATLRPKATRRLECLGFTKKCFEEFVNFYPFQKYSGEEKVKIKLKEFLKACSNVLNLCYLPFNASMICFLFDQFGEVETAPKTETEIYKLFILAVALRKLRVLNSRAQLQSLVCLPDNDKVIFKQLCLLAFNMTLENKQIVKLPLSLESLDSSSLRGLLTIDSTIRIAGLEDTVVFLHLTLQEYLAACHLASLDEHQQTEMIRLHSGKNHMLTMFKFYCGLVDFQNKLQQFDDIVKRTPNILYVFHCAYETQLACVRLRAMELFNGVIILESCVLTPAEFNVLAYVITSAPHLVNRLRIMPCLLFEDYIEDTWKNKEIDYADVVSSSFRSSISDSNVRVGVEYDLCTQVSYHNKSTLKNEDRMLDGLLFQLCFKKNPMMIFQSSSDILSSDSAVSLVNVLKHCSNIEDMALVGNFSSMRSASILKDLLQNSSNLKEFLLCGHLSSSEVKLLTHGLQHSKSLQTIRIFGSDLSSSMKEISTTLMHCSNMRKCILYKCNINSENAELLLGCLGTVILEELCLSGNSIGPNGMKLIAENFLCKELVLVNCNIGPEGAMHLAHSILLKPVLTHLDLADNGIDSIGTIALAEGLSHCCNLQELNLSFNIVGCYGAVLLAMYLQSCSKLRKLFLAICNLGVDGIVRLAEQFHLWRNMEYLNFSFNGVISGDHMFLFTAGVQQLPSLQELYLSHNSIDDAAATTLAEGIQNCPLLHTLNVCDNRIGSYGASVLAQSMKCEEIKYLDFSFNLIDDACIELFVAMILTSQLKKLDLSFNRIGPTGSKCLVSNLLDCSFPVEVNLAFNHISPEDILPITQLLQRNIHLHILLK